MTYLDISDVEEADALGGILVKLLLLSHPDANVGLGGLDKAKRAVDILDAAGGGSEGDGAGRREDGEGDVDEHVDTDDEWDSV